MIIIHCNILSCRRINDYGGTGGPKAARLVGQPKASFLRTSSRRRTRCDWGRAPRRHVKVSSIRR